MASGIFTLKQQELALVQGAWTNQKPLAVDYLVVAGGGGGGSGYGSGAGGGGGAGGLLQGNIPVATGTSITVTVGGGGGGASSAVDTIGTTGSNSVFGSITAFGGGGGRSGYASSTSNSGGSGGSGGAPSYNGPIGQGTFGQGNPSGNTNGAVYKLEAGGGGGAGTVGLNARDGSRVGGGGGAGVASDISGTRTTYAGGGGGAGAAVTSIGGQGGAGGGGGGYGEATSYFANGTANTGGGGGGHGANGSSGANGGSGIVILSYPDTYNAAASTTGSPTISTSGSGSLYFDGTGDYLAYANGTFNLGNNDFVIESFFYVTSSGGYYTIAGGNTDLATQTGSSWNVTINNTGTISGTAYSGSTLYQITTTATVSQNVWNHIVFVRTGGTISLFLNGTKDGTNTTLSTASINNGSTTYPPCVGANGTSNVFIGYLSNTRIIIGANASNVYNATSSSITTPTAPLRSVTNTTLLLNTVSGSQFVDSSGNSYVATVAGNTVWNSLSPITTGLGYKNRVYTWTSSGSITF